MNDRDKAAELLRFYFRRAAKAAGANWDSDNDGEIETVVDCLINAAVTEVRNAPVSLP